MSDEVVHRGAAMKEPGHEEMRSTVEKEDFDVDKRLLCRCIASMFSLARREADCQCAVDVGTS